MSNLSTTSPTSVYTNWTTVFVATFAGASVALQIGKAAACLPLLRDDFGADVAMLALFVSLISIVAALSGIAFGLVTRWVGVYRSALIGLACVATGSAIGAVSLTLPGLLGSRILEAAGLALCTTSLPVLIQRATASHQKALALGVWATWMPFGIAIAMAMAYLSLDALGWRGIFWLCAFFPVAALIGLICIISSEKEDKYTGASRPLGHVLRARVVLMASIFIMFSAGNMIVIGFLPTLLVDDFAIGAAGAALYLFLAMLFLLPLNVLTGRLLDSGYSQTVLLSVAFTVMAVTSFILYTPIAPVNVRLASIFMVTQAAAVPPAIVWASTSILARGEEEGPMLAGLFYQGAGIGQVSGPIIAGLAVEYFQSWAAAAWIISGTMVTAFILTLAMLWVKPGKSGGDAIATRRTQQKWPPSSW